MDGFEDVGDENQAKIIKAFQDGHVADEDIPESARKPVDANGDKEPTAGERKSTRKKAAPKEVAEVGDLRACQMNMIY